MCPGGRLEYRSSCNLRLPMAVLLGGWSSLTAGTGRWEAYAPPGDATTGSGKGPLPLRVQGGPSSGNAHLREVGCSAWGRHDRVRERPPALTGTGGALIRNRASPAWVRVSDPRTFA